ncbi:MAG: hypothetical protein HZB38_05450 [Planctomycetes bacterium]|nr:hypothetical protein [Planctomycetota bacterium]
MFRQRIRWFAIGMTLLAGVIVARLLHIQMVLAADYRAISDRLLSRDARTIPAPRGDIVDRTGRVLVSDEPAWDISIKYDILAGRSEYLVGLARQWKAQGLRPKNRPERELVNELRMEVARSWQRLSELSGDSIADFVDRGEAVLQRVERIRENILRRSGVVRRLREEGAYHPIVYGIDDELALKVRLELEQNCPWIAVVPGSRRIAQDVDSLVHVLGRMGAASREQIAADPLADDEDRALRPGETCGVSGVEYAAESLLRGTRGMVAEDLAHVEIERREPIRGDSVRLSIDADLQDEVYAALAEGVQTARTGEGDGGYSSTGGAAVVLDVDTREILALVSYPAYRYDQYRSDYDELAADRIHMPLRFRAVSEQYPPGSTCKIITAVAGLQAGVITPEMRIHCRGYLHENQPNAFRCWIYNQHAGATHDMINPEGQTIQDAIRYSCNIFFYQVGDRRGGVAVRVVPPIRLGLDAGDGAARRVPGDRAGRRISARRAESRLSAVGCVEFRHRPGRGDGIAAASRRRGGHRCRRAATAGPAHSQRRARVEAG